MNTHYVTSTNGRYSADLALNNTVALTRMKVCSEKWPKTGTNAQ
jgi:hypothetical protein